MEDAELELEQWECSTTSNLPHGGMNVMIGNTVAVKCNHKEEGYLLFKPVEIKQEIVEKNDNGKENSLRDVEYDSEPFGHKKDKDIRLTSFTPLMTIQSSNPNQFVKTSQIGKDKMGLSHIVNEECPVVEESSVLDLSISKSLIINENYSSPNIPVPTITEKLSESTIINETKLTGVCILESIIEARPPVDTILSCSDGKLGAHRIVLTAVSQFLFEIFVDQRLEDIVVVILPDITKNTMISLLHLAYTGRMIYTEDTQDEIYSAMECLIFGDFNQLSLHRVISKQSCVVKEIEVSTAKDSIPPSGATVENNVIVQESPVEQQPCSSIASTSTIKSTTASTMFTCSHCPRKFTKNAALHTHITKCHSPKTTYFASVGEFQMLSFCDICDHQYKTVNRALFCYNQHGLTRCLVCLGVFPTTDIKDHYGACHAKDQGDDLVVKCRWCQKYLSVKNSCNNVTSHSSIHWPGTSIRDKSESTSTLLPVSETQKRSKKLNSTATKQIGKGKSLKNYSQHVQSRKRDRSVSDEEESNLKSSKYVKTNKLQLAVRTGGQPKSKEVREGSPSNVERDRLLNVDQKHVRQKNLITSHCKNTTNTKIAIDINNLPEVYIKLDLVKDIEDYMNKNKRRSTHYVFSDSQICETNECQYSTGGKEALTGIANAEPSKEVDKSPEQETTLISCEVKKESPNATKTGLENETVTNLPNTNGNEFTVSSVDSTLQESNELSTSRNSDKRAYPMSCFPTHLNGFLNTYRKALWEKEKIQFADNNLTTVVTKCQLNSESSSGTNIATTVYDVKL